MIVDPFFESPDKNFTLVESECVSALATFDLKFDMIFADPPYFLSNGGISRKNGKVVSVDKGEWDKISSSKSIDEFYHKWLLMHL